MPEDNQAQPAQQAQEVVVVVETIQPQAWGGEPLNTSRNALSDKGENGGPISTKIDTGE